MPLTRPMLAVDAGDLTKLTYPRLASPKLDGIRCLKVNGRALSRSFKPIPNLYIRQLIEASNLPDGIDGELILTGGDAFNKVSSAVMKRAGEPEFEYRVFDIYREQAFWSRYSDLQIIFAGGHKPIWAKLLYHTRVDSAEELALFEEACIAEGYEGVITRTLGSPYKCGRSTLREEYMLKVKRFVDSEAYIIGMEEMEYNLNPQFKGELGQAKRSSAQFGKQGAGMMGAVVVQDATTKVVHNVGSGFTQAERLDFWKRRQELVGNKEWLLKYKFQEHGTVEKPRSPIYLGLRHVSDL